MQLYAGAASKAAQLELGGTFQFKEFKQAVGVQAVKGIPDDPNRIGYILTNYGVTNITLSSDPAVVSGEGILLLGNGSTLKMNYKDDADAVALGLYAVSDAAGGLLHRIEIVQAFEAKAQEG